jgi:hypothetical protein
LKNDVAKLIKGFIGVKRRRNLEKVEFMKEKSLINKKLQIKIVFDFTKLPNKPCGKI